MLKLRFKYLLPLLLAVLSAANFATAQMDPCVRHTCQAFNPGTGCDACGPGQFSLDDRWRQYVINQDIVGVKLTGPGSSWVEGSKVTYLYTTASGVKLAEITQVIEKPASSRQQVLPMNEEAMTAFHQHAKNKNRLTIKVETAGGREEHSRVQLVAIKRQGPVAKQ
jgi:hypothetical protein